MKKISIAIACFIMLFNSLSALAWGPMGHDVVAAIAEQNLTRKAKKNLDKLLGGHSIVYYSSWMDNIQNSPYWNDGYNQTKTWHYANVDKGHTYQTMPKNEKGDVVTALTKLTWELTENDANLTDSMRVDYVKMIVHMMGDMHCPMHIVYLPDNVNKGHYFVYWKGKQQKMHVIWDGRIFDDYYKWGFLDMAYLVDTATPEQIAEITKGTVYDYASNSARDSWPVVSQYVEGDPLPKSYATDVRSILFSQLRNGGYRLAAIFNEAFK